MTAHLADGYRCGASILERSVDGQVVVYNPATDQIHALDPIGSIVWGLLDRPLTVDNLVDTLADQFDEPSDRIRADVEALLTGLIEAGLIDADVDG